MTRRYEEGRLARNTVCLTVMGLLLAVGNSHADISYCGPVSYKYTRTFEWNRDYTSKQGFNHKQIKEERRIFDGEWYICLDGRMLGNRGMFDGDFMQQEFTYSEIDNWLDLKRGTSGRKHNNASLPEGQQGYMRGSLLLNCPEGNQLPGKTCDYTLNLTFGTGYVFQTNQQTFTSSDEPPESLTLSIPLAFSRTLLLEDRPVADGWSIEGNLNRDIKVEEQVDQCAMEGSRPHIDACSYEEKETASWDLKRIRGPCDAYVSKFKGDVTINGKPVSGIVNLTQGDVITTGAHSKIQVTVGLGDNYYIGSNTQFQMNAPCDRETPNTRSKFRIVAGYLTAKIENLLGVERDFEVRTGTAVVGVRGNAPHRHERIMAFIRSLILLPETAVAATLPDDMPTLGTRVASVIFSVETIPKEKVTVEVFKGSVLIKDNKGKQQLLVKEHQTVSSWADGSPFEDVTITKAPN